LLALDAAGCVARAIALYSTEGPGLAPAGRHTMLDPAVSQLQEDEVQSRYGTRAGARIS
jgi:hypothetical protein